MASLFASPDIAALVAAFPPPLPTKNRPSLVRSHSGNALLNSVAVLDRFRTMLDTEPSRIKKSDLPHRLGIDRVDWLFACYEDTPPVRWSRNGTSLVPRPAWDENLKNLTSRCEHEFVDFDVLAKDLDLEELSSSDLNDINISERLQAIGGSLTRDTVYLASKELVDKVSTQINSCVESASGQKINLSRSMPTVPTAVLRQLAAKAISSDQLEDDEDGLIFVPLGYETAQVQLSQANHEARVQQLMERFENDNFVIVDPDFGGTAAEYVQEVFNRYASVNSDVEIPSIVDISSTTKLVARPGLLHRILRELKEEAAVLISDDVDNLIQNLDQGTQSRLVSNSSESVLAGLLLNVPHYSDQIGSAIEEAISERYYKQHDQFATSFRYDVLAPAQLYAAGIRTIQDPKLKQSLNDYLSSHFRKEVIADFAKSSALKLSMSRDKSSKRELQRFMERSDQAKGIGDLVSAMEKFAKKTNIALPSENERKASRRQVLERKVFTEMPKMTRGSDVLQNLIWILLSIATEKRVVDSPPSPTVNGSSTVPAMPSDQSASLGQDLAIFMSPGKDTGRMIKQYSAVAPDESEISNKLALWRDKLKAGSETKEDLDEMKKLGSNLINQMSTND